MRPRDIDQVLGFLFTRSGRKRRKRVKKGTCVSIGSLGHGRAQVWLRAWHRNKANPNKKLDFFPASWQPPTPLPSTWQDTWLSPVSWGMSGTSSLPSAPPGSKRTEAFLDDTAQEAILSKLADSTRRSYGAGWKQWQLFLASSQLGD